ncbi:ATP-dependent helicase [Pseudomonas putida]|uniref:ATP-dependent helicase n=1 Tax=Pseudomonas putida TaxID=303 RepID=UPI000E6AF103|nr:ATP-dependent helicase [Pseudomonas putida]RIZ40640.1 ATP-dependent DNA helicase Rep [Pseudomonas putida]
MSASPLTYLTAAVELQENADQWTVYESTGNCVILAGPGSGKTKTITVKIARLLTEDVRWPQRIACITYSNACVGELRTRLNRLGVEDGKRIAISTVHSFCLTELVLPFAGLAKLRVPDPLAVATPEQSRRFFAAAYEAVHGGRMNSAFRTACDRLRRTIPDRNSVEWHSWTPRQTRVVEAYEDLLLANGLIDFDGLVLAGLELVERHSWVRQALRAKYPVVVIDEYQDLGLPLHRIILALLGDGVRIIAVGDPDQSIYGFTGARPELLRTLAQDPRVSPVTLRLNYRCADRIIAASRGLLPGSAAFRSHHGRVGEISFYKLKVGLQGQAQYALETILPTLLTDNPHWQRGDIAFLYRSYKEGSAIAEIADSLGLRYFRLDNGSPIKRTRLTEWLGLAARWCSGGWKTGEVQLSHVLKEWQRLNRSRTSDTARLVIRKQLITALFSLRESSLPLHAWLEVLRDAALSTLLLEEPGLADEVDTFNELLAATAKDAALGNFTVQIFANQGKSQDQINLMTLHSSKGLEFQAVLMLALEDGTFPNDYDKASAEQLEEAGRLFYVGVTRAKEQVHMLYGWSESPFITAIRAAVR